MKEFTSYPRQPFRPQFLEYRLRVKVIVFFSTYIVFSDTC